MQNTPPPNQPPYGGGQPPYGGGNYPPPNQPPPGYGPPPPGYGAPPPGYGAPPPRKKGGLPWWAWVLIAVPLLSIVACIAAIGLGVGLIFSAKADAEKVVNQFMEAASVRDLDKMYSVYSSVDKNEFKKDAEANLLNNAYIADYQSVELDNNVSINSNNGRTVLNVAGKMKYKTKGTGPFTAQLIREGNDWRVLALDLSPPS